MLAGSSAPVFHRASNASVVSTRLYRASDALAFSASGVRQIKVPFVIADGDGIVRIARDADENDDRRLLRPSAASRRQCSHGRLWPDTRAAPEHLRCCLQRRSQGTVSIPETAIPRPHLLRSTAGDRRQHRPRISHLSDSRCGLLHRYRRIRADNQSSQLCPSAGLCTQEN